MACRRLLVVATLGILTFASLAYAQRIFVGGGRGSSSRPRFAIPARDLVIPRQRNHLPAFSDTYVATASIWASLS